MGTYSASLRAVGETTGLPATVELEDGQLSIAAGDHDIGTWALADIELEPVPNGYRMAAEGDQIIIELKELDAFQEALSNGRFKRRYKLRGKEKEAAKAESTAAAAIATTTAQPVREKPAKPKKEKRAKAKKEKPVKPEKKRLSSDDGLLDRGLAMLDNAVEQSHRRFGPYLPNWLFSRGAFVVLFLFLVILLLFPTILIILGGVVIAVGAVAYSDPVLASKVLPGRTQPPHALIGGVGLLLLGVIVGIITS